MKTKKKTIIQTAAEIVDVEREAEYGNPVENAVADAIIAATMGVTVSASDTVRVMLAKKIRRTALNVKQDTMVDVVGYTEILDRVIEAERTGESRDIAKTLIEHLL